MSQRLPVLALTAVAVLAAPATSHALAGAPSQACYTHLVNPGQDPTTETVTEPIVVNLSGGTPGGRYQVALSPGDGPLGGSGSISGDFDAAGNGVAVLPNVFPPRTSIGPLKGQTLRITATDYTAGISDQPIGETKITNLALSASSKPRNPRRKRGVKVSGRPFIGKRVYGFVTNKRGRKVLDRFKLGKANACGYVKKKRVVAPSPFRYGSFRLYLNAGKKLKRKQAIRTNFTIRRRAF